MLQGLEPVATPSKAGNEAPPRRSFADVRIQICGCVDGPHSILKSGALEQIRAAKVLETKSGPDEQYHFQHLNQNSGVGA